MFQRKCDGCGAVADEVPQQLGGLLRQMFSPSDPKAKLRDASEIPPVDDWLCVHGADSGKLDFCSVLCVTTNLPAALRRDQEKRASLAREFPGPGRVV